MQTTQAIALSPKAVNIAMSPSPAKPTAHGISPCKNATPTRGTGSAQHTPSPMANVEYPATECMCQTCQYYKACYMYAQEAHSPDMHSYNMYQYQQYYNPAAAAAMMGMGMNSMNMGSMSPQQGQFTSYPQRNHHSQSRSRSPMMSEVYNPVAEEFERSGNPAVEQFTQNIGNLAKVACTANGRSMLQAVMRLQHLDKIQTIFDELIVDAESVMLDTHGCHVVRSLVEVIDEHQLIKLMDTLHSKLILNMCTLSQYTRRILQSLFERHKSHSLQFIVEVMSNNAQYLAATQQGCISLMRVFERCTAEQKHTIAAPLFASFADLACDPFGNYVVQCILEHSEPSVAARYAMDCFNGEFLRLTCNKFGSNVCEKLIRNGNPQIRRIILDEIIFNPAALQQVASDAYGNFVAQTIVETCNSASELKKVCDRLRPTITQSPYGHKIDAKIRSKRFPQQMPNAMGHQGRRNNMNMMNAVNVY